MSEPREEDDIAVGKVDECEDCGYIRTCMCDEEDGYDPDQQHDAQFED